MERAGKVPIQVMVSPDTSREIDRLIEQKRFASRSDFGSKAIERFLAMDEYESNIRSLVEQELRSPAADNIIKQRVQEILMASFNNSIQNDSKK